MVFIYYSQGVSSRYQDFTERLMSHLALKGTGITHQEQPRLSRCMSDIPVSRARRTLPLTTRMSM